MVDELSELGKKTIEEFKNIKNLPTIPKVIMEVDEMLQDHSGDVIRLTEIIGKDQGLTTKILAVANSPLYGLPRNVSSLEFAIMLLGIGEVSNIVTALSFANTIKGEEMKDFGYLDFWNHSMIVGTASRDIAKRLGFPEFSGDAFVAGMLHDLGIQLTARYFPEQFRTIVELAKSGEKEYYQAEIEILGVTHEDIGCYMLSKWNLPNNLLETLGYHHNPSKCANKNVVLDIVHLADSMANIFNIGNFIWDSEVKYEASIIENLGFANFEELENFIDEYKEVFEDTADTMEL